MADDKDTDSQQPPAKLPRLSGADTSAGKYVRALAFWSCSLLITLEFVRSFAGEVTMAASSPLVLGLGLGLGAGGGERDAEAAPKRASALTFMQQQELEHQVLIYRYFAAGAPVPVHLVLPIWKSVAASSFGPQRFPSRKWLQSFIVF